MIIILLLCQYIQYLLFAVDKAYFLQYLVENYTPFINIIDLLIAMSSSNNQQHKAFFKRTRKGKVIRVFQEKYLRDDANYGHLLGELVTQEHIQTLVGDALHRQLLVLDTNVAVHQLDVLEHECPATGVVVVLQTVLQELRNLNLACYKRMFSLLKNEKRTFIFFPNELCKYTAADRVVGESPNDYNDRLIRIATLYFEEGLNSHGSEAGANDTESMDTESSDDDSDDSDSDSDAMEEEEKVPAQKSKGAEKSKQEKEDKEKCAVILLSNDFLQRQKATAEGIHALSMTAFVSKYVDEFPELSDLLSTASMPELSARGMDGDGEADNSQLQLFPPHASLVDVTMGLRPGGKYYRGVLQCKRGDNINDCYVIIYREQSQSNAEATRVSVSIVGKQNVNRAVSGDVVAVELISPDETGAGADEETDDTKRTTKEAGVADETAEASVEQIEGATATPLVGRVVGIVRRSNKQYAGSIDRNSITGDSINIDTDITASGPGSGSGPVNVLFVPVDKRIPKIRISTRRLDDLLGQRLLVALDHWPSTSVYPVGHYVRKLGADGEKSVETQVLLHEFGVPTDDFSADVMACLPPANWDIAEELKLHTNMYNGQAMISGENNPAARQDLRHIPVCSIDPPGCKDIDDALHCRRLENGNFEVGVHIADVTYFVHPDSPLDKEAAFRSTSTYLVERRLDMLPSLLTTELCSLRSKEDHLAFSTIWEMDSDGNILGDVKFCKSVIHSVASLTYDDAQLMIDMEKTGNTASTILDEKCGSQEMKKKVIQSVQNLNKFAIKLRQKRIDEGALTLASTEVRFKLDAETQSPTDVSMYALKQANALVEEFMLLANITVSKKILRHYPTLGVLRRHQPPSKEQFAPLVSAASAVGVTLDISSSKSLADSLDRAVKPDNLFFNKLLRILSTRCMMPAQYFCSGEIPKDQWHHYGLAAPVYTHFTSPIRRYADIIVHRLLAAAIEVIPLPPGNADRSKQQDQCAHMNKRHKSAQYVQRASVNLHTLLYFRDKPSTEEAYILSVLEDGITILVPKFGVEGTISFVNTPSEVEEEANSASTQNNHRPAYKYGIQSLEHNPTDHTIALGFENTTECKLQVFECVQVKIVTVETQAGQRNLSIELVLDDKYSTTTTTTTSSNNKHLAAVSGGKKRPSEKSAGTAAVAGTKKKSKQ